MKQDADKHLKRLWHVALALAVLAAAWALWVLLRTPSEAASAVLLGYSLERLVLAVAVLLPGLVFAALTIITWRQSSRLEGWIARLQARLQSTALFWALFVTAILLALACWVLIFLPDLRAADILPALAPYLPRLQALLGFGLALSALAALLLPATRYGLDHVEGQPGLWRSAGFFAGLMLLVAIIMLSSGLGLGYDITEYNAPGAPLLASQAFIAVALAVLFAALAMALARRLGARWVDIGLFLLVWAAAAALWQAQPFDPNYYASPPVPPNGEMYPLSDAFNHDVIANNALIGEDFRFGGLRAIRKPLYTMLLAGLHTLADADYAGIVAWQVIVLALFPAAVFAIGQRLGGRIAGLAAAGFIIFREANAIRLGAVVNLSHAKLLMADLPAALGLALLALAAFHWLRRRPGSGVAALAVGGLMGALMLLRSQQLTLIPLLALLALLALRAAGLEWRALLVRLLLFFVGVGLVAGPWLLRNKSLTGEWIVEQSTAASFLAQRYSAAPDSIQVAFLPGESEGEYYARHMATVKDYMASHPGEVLAFAADNYARNLYINAMPLPLSFELRDTESHVRELAYWPSWDGRLAAESLLPFALGMGLMALGLAAAWRRHGWAGLAPLVILLGFTANLALARVSGWRYNQPVDWIVLLYAALGLSELLRRGMARIGREPQFFEDNPALEVEDALLDERRLAWTAVALLILGSLPLGWEAASNPRYAEVSREQAAATLADADGAEPVLAMLNADELSVLHGAALYPRYYAAGDGVSGTDFFLVTPMDFERLTFFLIGPDPFSAALPVDSIPETLPSGSEVLVFICAEARTRTAAVYSMEDGRLLTTDPAAICAAP